MDRNEIERRLAQIGPRIAPYAPEIAAAAVRHRGARDVWRFALLLASVMYRESRGGRYLSPPGPGGTGDYGHGRGLMQIDDRTWGEWLRLENDRGPLWKQAGPNLDKGAEILAAALDEFPGNEMAGVCRYNAGPHSVRTVVEGGGDPNLVTTGKDYGRDVIETAAIWDRRVGPSEVNG